ncbi:MAG: pyridoxamine 5'-phosphate oxidase family protein [Carboxydocellales bacterium]
MAKLTAEMKKMIGENQCFIATVNSEGLPNIVPKRSTQVLDDDTLMFVEVTGKKTYQNLSTNPAVSIAVVNQERNDGYRFNGKAELIKAGPLFDNVTKKLKEIGFPVPKAVVKVPIDEVYTMNPKKAGERII